MRELKSLDLNLLVSLDALLRERSVTRAADRLGLSQPSLSAALAKLRRHFRDELLVRRGNQYEWTPLAVQLNERVTVALDGASRVFAVQPDFDPSTAVHQYTLLSSDYSLAVLGQVIAGLLAERAPRISVRWDQVTTAAVDDASSSLRAVDGLIVPRGFITAVPHQDLYVDEWVCVGAVDNPLVGDSLTFEDLGRLPWVLTFHDRTAYSAPAQQMRLLGIELNVQMVIHGYLAVPHLLVGSNRLALLQGHLARQVAGPGSGLRVLTLPFEPVALVSALWWHPMYERDPQHIWLRSLLAEAGTLLTAAQHHQID
ncbi:LysR family transcriptional regulator [Modestobacter sp. I12A-02628]|uniref:LysR family transcriptional regulator n=1 Tax=Goekera deserti TaxID=2497753 RepID=A0A7K3WE13_9ACTN|nr:LysR family transcriptional regulator [Goekera deserti]MPQ99558.1 LysR family transcriptional regulator [Goekera deserti]NDI46430.1 LysR family transcriptional regulator [Goekera deserti]NEL54637.1 LysR family transcriptional regulator [Goekera deserti]